MNGPFGLEALHLRVFERGWLSSNNVLFLQTDAADAAIVDTGYVAHAEQTAALVRTALGPVPLARIVNTHLHSDHCGGNARLQQEWPAVITSVPTGCYDAAAQWDHGALTFAATDQRCERFRVDQRLCAGQEISLGRRRWELHPAPGHDPTALMLFEPESRTLISGDALWERRLAIVFPELVGDRGFGACLSTLDLIERLNPRCVIPGHGRPFRDVAAAVAASRERVESFSWAPEKHRRHALRALAMFHLLDVQRVDRQSLVDWLHSTPITAGAEVHLGPDWAESVVQSLVRDGAVLEDGQGICARPI